MVFWGINIPFLGSNDFVRVVGRGRRSSSVAQRQARKTRVETESIVFNQKYITSASSPEQAFRLLTPRRIDALTRLGDTYDGRFIIGFYGNQVHIGVNNQRDSLAPVCSRPINAEIARVEEDIKKVRDFVIELSLEETAVR